LKNYLGEKKKRDIYLDPHSLRQLCHGKKGKNSKRQSTRKGKSKPDEEGGGSVISPLALGFVRGTGSWRGEGGVIKPR